MEPSVHEFVGLVEAHRDISTKDEMIAAVRSRFAMGQPSCSIIGQEMARVEPRSSVERR